MAFSLSSSSFIHPQLRHIVYKMNPFDTLLFFVSIPLSVHHLHFLCLINHMPWLHVCSSHCVDVFVCMSEFTRLYISWTSWGYGTDYQYFWDLLIWESEGICTNVTISCMSEESMVRNMRLKSFLIERQMGNAITLVMILLEAKELFLVATCSQQIQDMGFV